MLLIRTLVLSFVVAASTLAAGSTASQAEPADPVAQGSALEICGAVAAPATFNGSPYWPLLFGARSWVRPPADPAASTNNWGLD